MGLVKPTRSRLITDAQLPWSRGGMFVGSQTLRLASDAVEVFPWLLTFKMPLLPMQRNFFYSALPITCVLYNYFSWVVWGPCINLPYLCYANDVRQRNGVQLSLPPLNLPETSSGFTFIIGTLSVSARDWAPS